MLRRPHALALLLTLGSASAAGAALSLVGCEHDVVLPSTMSPAICGNGVVEPGEQCDNGSPGCINCLVAPEWTCPNNMCAVTCDDPGVALASDGVSCKRRATCNMEGYWAVRETDYTTPTASNMPSKSTQWYLYHVTQTGPRYAIDVALDCGIHVTGLADVDYTPNTEEFLMYTSGIDEKPHGPRRGDAEPIAGGCKVTLDRFFFVRGATTAYLPSNFDNDASLPPAPTAAWLDAPPLPAQPPGAKIPYDRHFPPGAVNTDGDASAVPYPGGGFRISGGVDGLRHSAQRDYKGYAATSPIAPGSLSFSFPGNYSLQESVLSVTDCTIFCGLLTMGAYPTLNMPPYVTFSYIGLLPTSTRTASVIGTSFPPKKNYINDQATCANIRLILPHDGSIHDGSEAPDASTH